MVNRISDERANDVATRVARVILACGVGTCFFALGTFLILVEKDDRTSEHTLRSYFRGIGALLAAILLIGVACYTSFKPRKKSTGDQPETLPRVEPRQE